MRRLVHALAISASFVASAALADNKYPAQWRMVSGGPGQTSTFASGFTNCQAADDAAIAAMNATHPEKTRCEGLNLCTPSFTGRLTRGWFDPGGVCNNISWVEPYCDEGADVFFDAQLGIYCNKPPFSKSANRGECKTCVGNPINPGIANKFEVATDYVGSGPFPLKIVRFYNSGGSEIDTAGLGRNWTHNYDRRLVFNAGPGQALVAAQRADGKLIPFALSNGVYVGDTTFAEKLERITGGWRLINTSDETELYDDLGRLLSITDRHGRVQTLGYDANGKLVSVTDPQGRSLAFTRSGFGGQSIASVTVPGSLVISYGYDIGMRLSTVTYPDTRVRTYSYTSVNGALLSGIVDEKGVQYAVFAYDSTGPVVSLHAGNADRINLANDLSLSVRNPTVTEFMAVGVSATRTYTFENRQGIAVNTAVTGPACPTCGPASQTFDAQGNTSTRTDWNGNRTNFAYDLARNLETLRREGLTAAGAITPQSRLYSTQWHPALRLVQRLAEPLRITTYVYNGDGGANCGVKSDGVTLVPGVLCSKTVQPTTDANGFLGFGATLTGTPRTWTYTYNANGQVLTIDGPRTDAADVTTYTYYADNDPDLGKRGNVATITNALGQTTSITAYNAHGQPLAVVDPNGLTSTMIYDARQRLTSRTVGGETATYDYDAAGLLTKVTLPDTSFLSYSYDDAHRLTGIQDNLGNRITYTLDFKGNRTKEEVFDPANVLAQTRSRVYSNINRLFQEIGAQSQTTQYAYDNQGNVTSVTDPLNHVTLNQYDPLNRLKQVTDPNLGVTQYAYSGLDALTQVTDPRSLVTGYTVDGLGNLNQQSSPDTGNTTNTYDAAGNLLTQTDAKGQVTTYAYDALNRVTLITFHDGSKQAYAYDQGVNALGRLSSITETNPANQVTSQIAYAYEQHGRVTSEARTIGGVAYVVAYSYDASGRMNGMTYPSGRTVSYAFDALGRVNQLNTTASGQTQVVVQNVAYHPFGVVKSFTLGNGQIYSRTVDLDGRIASYTLGSANYQLTFDPASRITGIAEAGNPPNTNTYGYDVLDRLTSAVLPSSSFGYSYDAVGNRLTKTVGANSDTYTYSPTSNRIASLTPFGSPQRSFLFDANGSTTNDGLNTYAYDTRGRMVQAVSGVGATAYQVNALGQRVRKTNSLTDTVFHYDTRGKLIAETDPAGALKRELIYLGDIPVGVVQ